MSDLPALAKLGSVRDWMSRRPVTVSPAWVAERVVRLMEARGIRHVLVVEEARLVGILSNRDVRRLLEIDPGLRPRAPVAQIMTENPVTMAPSALLLEAARAMLDGKIGAIPVVDDERVVGILTMSDVLEALVMWAEGRPSPAMPDVE
ncbi:MAG: CBS domain-containing protein [Candidatus Rokubacteria bacterium]|nr:CBS domain-containing protein [Candidatus Rokubacteria bacterium]